jgi:hypothetical protein
MIAPMNFSFGLRVRLPGASRRPTSHPTRILYVLAANVILAMTAGPAFAQASASQVVTGTGSIFLPIVLAKDTDLEFGTVSRPAVGSGAVTVDPSTGERSLSGQGALLDTGPSASRAAFTVSGEGSQTFSITVPPSMTMIRAGGAESIPVSLTPSATSGVLAGSAGGAGSATFGVGGELPVSSATTLGAYTGSFAVTVAYN